MAHSQASSTAATNPLFDQALTKHLEALPPEDREAFQISTAEDVIAAAEQLSSTHAAQSRARRYLVRFAGVVRPLQTYLEMVGNVAGSLPGAQLGGVVWGALLFVIKAINGLSDHFERIVSVLEEITQSLPFYQDYALEIYRESARVQQALADVYHDILVVCSAVRRVFLKKGGAPRSGPSIFFQALNPWNKTIDEVTRGLQRRREVLEREVVHADRTLDYADRVGRQRQAVEREWDDRRREFLALLPYEDCHTKHEDCLSVLSSENNSGNWFLNREEFLDWAYKPPNGILWVHGKPGVGKTVLASIIIEWARNTLISGKRPAVAFFFCEHDNRKKQDPRILLATLLHQVLRQLPAGPWEGLELDATDSLEKLSSSLKAVSVYLERTRPTFLIVDALDECDPATRKRLLPLLCSLGHSSRLLLTSRKEGDIANALKDMPSIGITAKDVENDIQEYINCKIKLADDADFSGDFLEVGDPALLENVSRTLIEGADGMFLWVQLQITHLQEQRTDYDVRCALRTLTRGLEPTYTRILKFIDRLPVPRRARAKRVLRWVACAEHPLSLCELSEAIAIHDMQGVWDKSRCVNRPTTLIEDCSSLILCTENSWQSPDAKVQLIHSSVKEFLLQNPILLGSSLTDYHIYPLPSTQVAIVEDCLKYLALLAEQQGTSHDLEHQHPFMTYACEFWPQHLRHSGQAGEQLVFTFCEFMQPMSPSREFWSGRYNRKRDDVIHTTMSMCHLAARLSLPHIVRPILANGLDVADAQGSEGLTALHWAAKFAEESTLRILVESGADINARSLEGQAPLHLAAGNWDGERVVQTLLDLGADIAVTNADGQTPLHVAAQNGYGQSSVLLLLQHGASVRKTCERGQSPLHVATANPYGRATVQYLLDYGADVNALNSQRRTPLHVAAGIWYRGIDSVRLLVEHGANVNATDLDDFTPLHVATQSEDGVETIKFLIEHGASVNVTSVNGTTPLHLVAKSQLGHKTARCLLENGADIQATDWKMQTPLHTAVESRRQHGAEVVQVLLNYGANIHAVDGDGLTPLLRTAQMESSDEIASLLLESGASPDDVDEKNRTPLHLAAAQTRSEDPRIARVLLRYGAKIDARDEADMTPLHHAAKKYDDTIMKILLEYGADVNAVTSLGQTVLHLHIAALEKKYSTRVVSTLLQHGANPGLVDSQGRTVYHYVSEPGELHMLVAAHS